jgi:hypothetical protein
VTQIKRPPAKPERFRPCPTTIYKEAAEGYLKLTKIGRKTVIAAPDALAWRERKRGMA